jgi:hypothetical protein
MSKSRDYYFLFCFYATEDLVISRHGRTHLYFQHLGHGGKRVMSLWIAWTRVTPCLKTKQNKTKQN